MCTHQHHREKREYPYPLFIQDSEAHHHKNQPLLPQGRQAKGGDILTKETCHKDGKELLPSKNKPPSSKSEAKGRGSRFFHIACMTSYLSVRRLPTPIATLQTAPKNIDIKNQT